MNCNQCNGSGCGGCGALTVPIGPTGATGATGAAGTNGTNGTDGAPGFLVFPFSIGGASPFILAGTAAGRRAATIYWPGTTAYPNAVPVAMRLGVYGTAVSPDYTVQIRDVTHGNAIVAHITNGTSTSVDNVSAMTINAGNVTAAAAVWEFFVIDNNLSNDKVNLTNFFLGF